MLNIRIILFDGIDSIAPNVLSLADSLHNSCRTYFGIKASGGISFSPIKIIHLNYEQQALIQIYYQLPKSSNVSISSVLSNTFSMHLLNF